MYLVVSGDQSQDMDKKSILVDGREFDGGRRTGISRFLEGLLCALLAEHPEWNVVVAQRRTVILPSSLQKARTLSLPPMSDYFWPSLARGYDLFLSPYPKLPWRRLPCPAIHTIHDVLYLTHPAYRGHLLRALGGRWVLRHALQQATLTWFDSKASCRACARLGPVVHAAVRFPAIDACFVPDEGRYHTGGSRYFLFVGNGLPHKNLSLLIMAMELVEARLICVGVQQPDRFIAMASPNVQRRLHFPTDVDDGVLLDLYRGATALLLPSTAEGFGYPPLEAMACGTPAVVADIPVLRETTGGAAWYCPANDVVLWRDAMHAMLHAETRTHWARMGLEWVDHLRAPGGWRAHIADMEHLVSE